MWHLVDAIAINRNLLKTHGILVRGASVHEWALKCAFSIFARSFYTSRPLFLPGALVVDFQKKLSNAELSRASWYILSNSWPKRKPDSK